MTISVGSVSQPLTRGPEQRTDTENANSAPDWWTVIPGIAVALFTFVLAAVSIRQFRTFRRQTDRMGEQVAAARASMVLTHRPKVIVRNVIVENLRQTRNLKDGEAWITNVGYSTAHILKTHAQWFIGKQLPMKNPINDELGRDTLITLQSGEVHKLSLPLKDIVAGEDATDYMTVWSSDPSRRAAAYILGFVKYRDDLGHFRRTVFCRRLNIDTDRFELVQDPDYEYTD